MLPTDVIENDAVYAVNKALNSTGYLSPNIPTKNTEPSWDGEVILYSDTFDHKKENIEGKIRIQVKGTMDEDLPNGKMKFSVSVIDLENYYKTGGVIFFVVHVNPDHSTKIYFETFTKVKLACILSGCKAQKTKVIEFSPLPENPLAVARIFSQFNIDCQKQYSFTEENMLTFENSNDSISKISFTVSCIGCNGNVEQALLSNEIYLYGSPKENDKLQIPYKVIPRNIIVGKQAYYNIYANRKLFYKSYLIEESKCEKIVCIGQSFKMHINSFTRSITINIKLPNTLNERVYDLDFLINVAYGKGFIINNLSFDFDLCDRLDLSRLQQQFEFLKDVKQLFNVLHIKNDIDITKLTLDDIKKLDQLIAAFLRKKPISLSQAIPNIVKYRMSDIQILVIANKCDEENNTYRLEDLFGADLMFAYPTENGYERVTVFSALKAEDYVNIANIDYCNIIDAYNNAYRENRDLLKYANFNVLELLSAYDLSNNVDQLEAAEKLADWIIEKDIECPEFLLNKLQIIKRRRGFNDEENRKLYELIENSANSDGIKLGAYILLDNRIMTRRYFDKLSADEKEEFMKYPIYKHFGERLLR